MDNNKNVVNQIHFLLLDRQELVNTLHCLHETLNSNQSQLNVDFKTQVQLPLISNLNLNLKQLG